MKPFTIILALLAFSTIGRGAPGETGGVILKGEGFQATVSLRQGSLVSLARKGRANLLTRPVAVSLRDDVTGKERVLIGPAERIQSKVGICSFVQQLPDVSVKTRVQAGGDLSIELRLENKTAERRDLSVWWNFDGLPRDRQVFFPGVHPHPKLTDRHDLTYGYRADGSPLVIPAATFYSDKDQTGLTVLSPLTIPVQGFQVRVGVSDGPRVGRVSLRLEPHAEVHTQIFVALHESDWRPGLAYIRRKYPDHFTAHNPRAVEMNGPFLWSPTAPEEQVRQWHDQGVRWVEVHFTYPFLGKYAPDDPRWTPAMDDQWAWEKLSGGPGVPPANAPFELIKRYLENVLSPWENPDRVRAFIRLLHRYDIKALMYFQPSECWERYAAEHFMSDAVHDAEGALVPAWYEDIVLNPRPGSEWATYLEKQFKSLLALYPEADGIFEDQTAYDLLDYAHDDGFSIDRGITADRMGYELCRLTSKFVDYAHSLGKTVWWNGPYQIELGAIGDGHLAEGSDEQIQWLGLGNSPITSGGWYPDLYERMLLIGGQPASPSLTPVIFPNRYAKEIPADARIPAEELRDFERYAPLFQQIRQREWVLTGRAVEIPPGMEGNIFRRPDGNYVVPVVTSWGGNSTGLSLDLPVTVRIPDAEAIRGVYLLKADLSGWFRVPWKREGSKLRIRIPRHHRASVLALAKTGVFAALDGDGTVVQGKPAPAKLVVDNWFDSLMSVQTTVAGVHDSFQLSAHRSCSLAISPERFVVSEVGDAEFPVRVTYKHGSEQVDLSFVQHLSRVPLLEVGWEGKLQAYVGEPASGNFYVINHGESSIQASLAAEGSGLAITGLPAKVALAAGERRVFSVQIRAAKVGAEDLVFRAGASGLNQRVKIDFPVWRTHFSSQADVVSGSIEFEESVGDGMPDMRHGEPDIFAPSPNPGFGSSLTQPPSVKPRPVYLDGALIGYLPSMNQSRWRALAVAIPPSRLWELRRTAEVSFAPANGQDTFRLRNLRLVLSLTDGSEISTVLNPHRYSTKQREMGAAEPIRVRIDVPAE